MTNDYCRVFDLTSRLPSSTIDQAMASGKLTTLQVPVEKRPVLGALKQISDILEAVKKAASDEPMPTRICVSALGSPTWGDLEPQVSCPRSG